MWLIYTSIQFALLHIHNIRIVFSVYFSIRSRTHVLIFWKAILFANICVWKIWIFYEEFGWKSFSLFDMVYFTQFSSQTIAEVEILLLLQPNQTETKKFMPNTEKIQMMNTFRAMFIHSYLFFFYCCGAQFVHLQRWRWLGQKREHAYTHTHWKTLSERECVGAKKIEIDLYTFVYVMRFTWLLCFVVYFRCCRMRLIMFFD